MENLGVFTDTRTLRFERRLHGAPPEVWRRLVGPDAMALWQASGEIEPRTGGAVRMRVGDPAHAVDGEVTACEPDRRFAYVWKDRIAVADEVTFELTPDGAETVLVMTHALSPLGAGMAAGWHAGLDALDLAVAGASEADVEAARAGAPALRDAYAGRFHAARARRPGAYMRDLFRVTPFHAHLGLELTEVTPERLAVRLTKRGELTLPGGALHGGALAAAMDVAGAYHAGVAAQRRLDEAGEANSRSFGVRTLSLDVEYLRPLTAEVFMATTTILHAGSSIIRVRAECIDDRGDLVATAGLNFSY